MTLLSELQSTIAGVAERVGPSVVGLGRGWAAGSGVVVADGQVVTVAHAVRRGEPTVTFAGGRRAEATIAGVDHDANVAVLSVDTGDAPAVEVAGETPGLGAAVLALADPGGRGLRASLGGLILAVPLAADLIERLARGERVEPRRLGIALAPPYVARRMRRAVGLPERDGLLVRGVRDGSPADRAGVRRGDLIVAVNGSETDRLDTLHAAVDSGAPTLELGLVRGAEELTVTVAFDADVQTV